MTMYKHTCTCGTRWFSEVAQDDECENDDHDDEEEYDIDYQEHIVKSTNRLTSADYVELWEEDLEDANYHSFTELPSYMLAVLSETIKDPKLVRKTMKRLYEVIGVLQ